MACTPPALEVINVDTNGDVLNVVGGGEPTISGDGRYVAFTVALGSDGDRVGTRRIYRRDRDGTTEMVSLLPDGSEPELHALKPSLSRDGNRLAFATRTNASSGQVYVRDIEAGQTVLASANYLNPQVGADGWSLEPSLSDDGTTVTYISLAEDLIQGPAPSTGRIPVAFAPQKLG